MMDWAEFLFYDESSPSCLRWKVDRTTGKGRVVKRAGDVAGWFGKIGYWIVSVEGRPYYCHRIIVEMVKGREITKNHVIDHLDGNTLNNKIYNLREVDKVGNSRNGKKPATNTSGVCGVHRSVVNNTGKDHIYWVAQWNGFGRKGQRKNFSVEKLGEDEAFRLACEWRRQAIDELNKQGAGYTDRHGI